MNNASSASFYQHSRINGYDLTYQLPFAFLGFKFPGLKCARDKFLSYFMLVRLVILFVVGLRTRLESSYFVDLFICNSTVLWSVSRSCNFIDILMKFKMLKFDEVKVPSQNEFGNSVGVMAFICYWQKLFNFYFVFSESFDN